MNYEIPLPTHDDLGGFKNILHLKLTDPRSHRDSLELMATYFKREFKYDHLQYETSEHTAGFTGILFLERAMDLVEDFDHYPNRVIGGAGFWKKTNGYILDWVWLHPFFRNRGNLKKHWPELRNKFGDFDVSPPVSSQMGKFLERNA
ncbi:hypothetical protein [Pseudomonas sp. IT-P294]|uniref:hypothetical protein n=1 Tax=Pseudomonas sp. IT-P294 TaxID=3026454 RepID=UPI0039DFE96A